MDTTKINIENQFDVILNSITIVITRASTVTSIKELQKNNKYK